jgi:hypothetical protein
MRNAIVATLAALVLFGCAVVSASGPQFSSLPQSPLAADQVRVYAFRDKVLYLAQAPHVVRATIAVDGRTVGSLANGGFLMADVPTGHHSVSAASASYLTVRYFDAVPGSEVYVQVYDKTRMQGVPIIAAVAVGGVIGGAVVGAAVFSGGAERVWGVDLVPKADAWPVLQGLSLSE